MTVTVVGAGIAGASCARVLHDAGVAVQVVERGRAPGGRMASPEVAGRRVDLGAAYLTARDDDFTALVQDWLDRGLVREWTDTFDVVADGRLSEPATGPVRYAATGGSRSLVRDLLDGLEVRLGAELTETTDVSGDAPVVLAMPDPQAIRVTGPLGFAPVDYEPVIAVAAGYDRRRWPIADAAFVNGHPDLSLVADDGARRGDGAAVLVAHTTAERARAHLDDPDAAVRPVLDALAELLGVDAEPSWIRAHRWTYAQPAGTHGDAAYFLDGRVGIAGDAWCPTGSPRVESAWLSGRALGRALVERIAAP